MCDIHELVEAGGIDSWSDARIMASLPRLEMSRGRSDRCQAALLAELARRGRSPETMFGSKLTASEALRRTKTAVALGDGSLPGAAAALAAGDATLAHVNALAELKERLPDGAVAKLLPLAKKLPPDKFRRAALRLATPVEETIYFAGEAAALHGRSGTVHGAIASGIRAAELVIGDG